jgi:outer membrane protein
MKKESLLTILIVFNVLLLAAVIVLFTKVYSGKASVGNTETLYGSDSISSQQLPLAYINVDSLLINYEFAKSVNESLIKKTEDARLEMNSKARQLQNDMGEFQRKLDNNAFLSRERAEQEQQRLLQRQQQLQERDQQLQQQLMQQQQALSQQLRDTINSFLNDYNKNGRYELIISNTASDNILHAKTKYDITSEVILLLNKRYSSK